MQAGYGASHNVQLRDKSQLREKAPRQIRGSTICSRYSSSAKLDPSSRGNAQSHGAQSTPTPRCPQLEAVSIKVTDNQSNASRGKYSCHLSFFSASPRWVCGNERVSRCGAPSIHPVPQHRKPLCGFRLLPAWNWLIEAETFTPLIATAQLVEVIPGVIVIPNQPAVNCLKG